MRKLLASDHPTGMHNHLFLVKFIALQHRKLEPLSYIDHIYLDANTCTSNINPKKTNLNTATISAPTAGFQNHHRPNPTMAGYCGAEPAPRGILRSFCRQAALGWPAAHGQHRKTKSPLLSCAIYKLCPRA